MKWIVLVLVGFSLVSAPAMAEAESAFPKKVPGELGVILEIRLLENGRFGLNGVEFSKNQIHAVLKLVKPALKSVSVISDKKVTPERARPILDLLGQESIKNVSLKTVPKRDERGRDGAIED